MLREQLAVQVEPVEMVPAVEQMQVEVVPPKQEIKSKLFSKYAIALIIAIVAILAVGAYSYLDASELETAKAAISSTHDKLISHGDSSKSEGGSKSGSQSSKSSEGNTRPNAKSLPASKGIISSNPGFTGLNGSGGDDPDRNDDDGDKRDRKLKRGSSTGGSTEEDSSEDSSDEQLEEDVYWVDTRLEHNPSAPLVGNLRT